MTKFATYMGIPRRSIPWFPRIDPDLCTECAECLDVCPNNVFASNEGVAKTQVANPYNCVVLCDKCASFCPGEAISFPDKEETKRLINSLRASARQGESI